MTRRLDHITLSPSEQHIARRTPDGYLLTDFSTLGEDSGVVPPDPIPNSEVKRSSAYGSAHPRARVGHRQAPIPHSAHPPVGVVLWGVQFSIRRRGQHRSKLPARSHHVECQRAFSEPRSASVTSVSLGPTLLEITRRRTPGSPASSRWMPGPPTSRRRRADVGPIAGVHCSGAKPAPRWDKGHSPLDPIRTLHSATPLPDTAPTFRATEPRLRVKLALRPMSRDRMVWAG